MKRDLIKNLIFFFFFEKGGKFHRGAYPPPFSLELPFDFCCTYGVHTCKLYKVHVRAIYANILQKYGGGGKCAAKLVTNY